MARAHITNIKGPQGDQGPQGIKGNPGVNSVANDTATAAQIQDPGSETVEALKRTAALTGGLYMPTPYAALRWRKLRDSTAAGLTQGHIAIAGDSIASGSAVPIPRPDHDWPGRFRALLDRQFGPAGTGIIIADSQTHANPTWDPRIAVSGTSSTMPYGLFRQGCVRVAAATGSSFFLKGTSDTTVVYNLAAGAVGLNTATSESVSKTFRNTDTGALPTVERDPKYGQLVTRIPWGSVVTDRVTSLSPPTSGSSAADMYVFGVEALISGPGTFRVTNASVNGQSLATLFAGVGYDDGNAFFGLSIVDMIDANLLVIALGTNDWQASRTVADLKANLTTLIQRQRSTAAGKPAGDAMLLWNPQPDLGTFQPPVGPTWEAYREAYYEVATAQNVPLLDLGLRWENETTATALGVMTDGIHPNANGSIDIAAAVFNAVMTV